MFPRAPEFPGLCAALQLGGPVLPETTSWAALFLSDRRMRWPLS